MKKREQIEKMHERYRNHRIEMAKWYGRRHGLKGNQGGWIYNEATGRVVVQGWSNVYHKYRQQIWQEIEQL